MSAETGVVCPSCGKNGMGVRDTRRATGDGALIRRRRVCHSCGYRMTTHEIIVGDEDYIVDRRVQGTLFLREMEQLVRRYFGDDAGMLASGPAQKPYRDRFAQRDAAE